LPDSVNNAGQDCLGVTIMTDPLSDVIALLRPRAVFAKSISGAGAWGVRYSEFGQPSFCVVLEGSCRLSVDGHDVVTLQAGDFVLLPKTPAFVLSSLERAGSAHVNRKPTTGPSGDMRYGTRRGRPDMQMLGGYFEFDSPDAVLLTSLFPAFIHVRGVERLSALVRMVAEETKAQRSGRDLVLERLVELLLIEALRWKPTHAAPPGLISGLSDERIAQSMREIHANPARPWTVERLARKAALSRSAFYERFARAVGVPPMEYVVAWRMALAKHLLRRDELEIDEVANRVGYSSASTFSTAFSRHVGQPPSQYARRNSQTGNARA
jgi:AraC-like DNA-binding protein